MATTKKTKKPPAAPEPCEVCAGSGDVPVSVRVGRRRRVVGEQTGLCLACFGSGQAAPADS